MDWVDDDGDGAGSATDTATHDGRPTVIPSFRRLVPLSPPAVNHLPSAYLAGALVQDDAVRQWSVSSHHLFSPESRQLVRLLLLIGNRLRREAEGPCPRRNSSGKCAKSRRIRHLSPLPVEIWHHTLAILSIKAVGQPVDTLAGTGSDG